MPKTFLHSCMDESCCFVGDIAVNIVKSAVKMIYCYFFLQHFLINGYLTYTSSPDNACHVVRLLSWNILQFSCFGILACITRVVSCFLVNPQYVF